MNTTHMPPAHAVAADPAGESHAVFRPSAETVRLTLIYLALTLAAVLMAAACIAHWRVYF